MIGRLLLAAVLLVGLASIILWVADVVARRFGVKIISDALDGVGGWPAIVAKVLGKLSLNLTNRPQL